MGDDRKMRTDGLLLAPACARATCDPNVMFLLVS
jgi:hypothetical protein